MSRGECPQCSAARCVTTADPGRSGQAISSEVRQDLDERAATTSLAVAGDAVPAAADRLPWLLDPELVLHHRYGAEAECLYLVRPDGYVGHRSHPAGSVSLRDYLARIFT
jgi:hypothetical protein